MPALIFPITYFIPARYFLVALRAIILKGAGFPAFWDQILALAFFGVLSLALSSVLLGRDGRGRGARRTAR